MLPGIDDAQPIPIKVGDVARGKRRAVRQGHAADQGVHRRDGPPRLLPDDARRGVAQGAIGIGVQGPSVSLTVLPRDIAIV